MVNPTLKILSIGILMLMLAIPLRAQNTKGDKPVSRENRFKKTVKKEKPARRVKSNKRTTTSLRAYRPRKKSKGGERAGRSLSPIYTSKPSERQRKNVFPQRGPYVNNSSRTPRETQRRQATPAQRTISARSSSGRSRNVYSQSGRFVNHSSTPDRGPGRRRKIKPRSASRSFIARRSVNAWATFPRPKQKRERAYKGDIAGRRIRTKNFETKRPEIIQAPTGRARLHTPPRRNTYSQQGRVSASPRRRASANVYPQRGPYVNNPSRKPRQPKAGVSNRSTLARLGRLQSGADKPGKKRKIVPRSASGSYIARRSTNVWTHFPRAKKKGERAYTKDIAGRPLRTKNFETKRPVLVNPTARPYKPGKKIGDRPYRGTGGGYSSSSRSGRAWRGDITHRKIRGRNFTSKKTVEGQPVLSPLGKRPGFDRLTGKLRGSGYRSRSGRTRAGVNPIPVRPPGIGAKGIGTYKGNVRRRGFGNQGEEFSGNIKQQRRAAGGGSVSGRLWNNRGTAISARPPGKGAQGIGNYKGRIKRLEGQGKGFLDQGEGYTGIKKTRRPAKGGGSVSGRLWNNRQSAIAPRTPGIGANRIGKYQGNIKGGRPDKGGGSVSGRLWNNRQTPIAPRTPGMGADRIGKYQGNIKRGRPDKGGGSVSGKLWNNRQTPIAPRTPGIGADRIGKFQGNIKRGRPEKGGGSVSGKLWNNDQTAIRSRPPSRAAAKAGGFPGKIKRFSIQPGFNDQGEEYSGDLKGRRRAPKGGGSVSGKLWNNRERPIDVRVPVSEQGGEFRGHLKVKQGYAKNPNSAEEALKKKKLKTTYLADGLQIKVKQRPYGNRKDAIDGTIPGIKPTKETVRAGEYKGFVKGYKYVRNPNSADEALNKRKLKTTYLADGLQIKVKQRPYGNRKNAIDGTIPGIKPTKESVRASEYKGFVKSSRYVRNPNSSDDALKTRDPGKAFARATDYQGNIKMRKFDLFGKKGLHPDAQFVKLNKNNVAGEKDAVTNFKLWWSRLFKKNDTQPGHLKYKGGKPRYDKGEQGLWYD